MRRPVEVRWECAECGAETDSIPCWNCGSREIESVWSDGVRVDALTTLEED